MLRSDGLERSLARKGQAPGLQAFHEASDPVDRRTVPRYSSWISSSLGFSDGRLLSNLQPNPGGLNPGTYGTAAAFLCSAQMIPGSLTMSNQMAKRVCRYRSNLLNCLGLWRQRPGAGGRTTADCGKIFPPCGRFLPSAPLHASVSGEALSERSGDSIGIRCRVREGGMLHDPERCLLSSPRFSSIDSSPGPS